MTVTPNIKRKGSMSSFEDLVITKKDYKPSPDNPEYYILDQALLLSLREEFERAVKEVFPEDEWEVAEGEIPWDTGLGVKVTPVNKSGEPSRRSYVLDYAVVPSMSKSLWQKDTGTENATVLVRILIYTDDEYSGLVCDHEWSGAGNYNPYKWALEAHQILTGYLVHGQIYSGY